MVYDKEQWRKDRIFSATAGQEATEEVYMEMLNCMPPLRLPKNAGQYVADKFGFSVFGGFLMGEPNSTQNGQELYLAFGSRRTDDPHYYFLGRASKDGSIWTN